MSMERDSNTAESQPEARSRRAILAGALGGVAGLIAGRLGSPSATQAAAGGPIIMGAANNAGASNTTMSTNSAGTAFQVNQNGTGTALRGQTSSGIGGFFTSASGKGVAGTVTNPDSYGVYGEHAGASAGAGAAIYAKGTQNTGLLATTANDGKYAVDARGANGTAIHGSAIQVGVHGEAYRGVYGTTGASAFAAAGVWGSGGTGTDNYGVLGDVNNAGGRAVYGTNSATSGAAVGVFGKTASGSGEGVHGEGESSTSGTGVRGIGANGVYGTTDSTGGNGVFGASSADNSLAYAVWGVAAGAGKGVVGDSATGYALYGYGNGAVTGTFAKASGTFKIDHPLDPANKYLQHSFVESPDMMNVYNGNTKLDANGAATVKLPDWFEALNQDFRYQLTAIGKPSPDLHVKSGVKDNSFAIAGGTAGQDVSWQVTGIRHDAWAKAHPVKVEVAKTGKEKGKYLHPAEHGKAASKGIAAMEKAAKK